MSAEQDWSAAMNAAEILSVWLDQNQPDELPMSDRDGLRALEVLNDELQAALDPILDSELRGDGVWFPALGNRWARDAITFHADTELVGLWSRAVWAFWILLGCPVCERLQIETERKSGRTQAINHSVYLGSVPWWPRRPETASPSSVPE